MTREERERLEILKEQPRENLSLSELDELVRLLGLEIKEAKNRKKITKPKIKTVIAALF